MSLEENSTNDSKVHTAHNQFSPYELYTHIPENLSNGADQKTVEAVLTNPTNFIERSQLFKTDWRNQTTRNKEPIETPNGEPAWVSATMARRIGLEDVVEQTDYSMATVIQRRDNSYQLAVRLGSHNAGQAEQEPVFNPEAVLRLDHFEPRNIATQFQRAVQTSSPAYRLAILDAARQYEVTKKHASELEAIHQNPGKKLTAAEAELLSDATRILLTNVLPDVPALKPNRQTLVDHMEPIAA